MEYTDNFLDYIDEKADLLDESTPQQFLGFLTVRNQEFDRRTITNFLWKELSVNVFDYLDDSYLPYALYRGLSITDFSIPENISVVPDHTFANCVSLKSIRLHDGVRVIGSGAFKSTYSLTTVKFPNSLEKIESNAFMESGIQKFEAPANLTTIEMRAFKNCSSLTDVTLTNSVQTIGSGAFRGTGIKEITIPGSCAEIDNYAFMDCKDLSKVIIEDGVKTVMAYAFSNCDNLTEIEFPQSIRFIYKFPAGFWAGTNFKVGRIKFKIKGLSKEEARIWADKNIIFDTEWARTTFIHKIV